MHALTVRPAQIHLERPLPVDIDDAVAAIVGETERLLTLAPFTPSEIELEQTNRAPWSVRLQLGGSEESRSFTGELFVRWGSNGSTALALDGRFENALGRLTPEGPTDAVHAFFDQVVRRLGTLAAERGALRGVPLS